MVKGTLIGLRDLINNVNKLDLTKNLDYRDKILLKYFYQVVSDKIVNLNNDSSLVDFERVIGSLDMKSKGFINKTHPSSIPLISGVWDFFDIEKVLKDSNITLTQSLIRTIIRYFYYFVTVVILQRLVSKIVYLKNTRGSEDSYIEFTSLLTEYLRKVDPRIRRYLKGSRVNILNKTYLGYDTEFEVVEYGKVSLLSVQLSGTGTIVIRVNNVDNGFDFTSEILADGTRIHDRDLEKSIKVLDEFIAISQITKAVISDLRSYMENSRNNSFVEVLHGLCEQGFIHKTNEADDVLEFTVPLRESDGVPVYENYFSFHESGEVNPTFSHIIDVGVNLTKGFVEERFVYFRDLLNKYGNGFGVSGNDLLDSYDPTSLDPSTVVDPPAEEPVPVVEDNPVSEMERGVDQIVKVGKVNEVDKVGEAGSVSGFNEILNTLNKGLSKVPISLRFTGVDKTSSVNGSLFIETSGGKNPFVKDNILPRHVSTGLRGEYRRSNIIILGCHFSIADLSILSDFDQIKDKFDNIQGTLLTINRPFLVGKGKSVTLRDTVLLAPQGSNSLRQIGNLYNFPKLDVGDYISRMSDLRNDSPSLFKQYAVRDAEITLRHLIQMEKASFKITGVGNVPTTLSSLARNFVFKYWRDSGIDLDRFIYFGKYYLTDFESIYTPKGLQSTGVVGLSLPLFLGGFRGGRNESYAYGVDSQTTWYDYDLISAYTTSMSLLGIPDFNNTLNVDSQIQLNDFLAGILVDKDNSLFLEDCYSMFHVRFSFNEDVLYPCLPVSIDDSSTLYPLNGETIVTGYELYLARLQGCKINLIKGIIIPFTSDGVKPYLDVVKYLQKERKEFPVRSLYNLLYKEMGNSIYGQTAQGLGKIKRFNTRTGKLENMGSSSLSNPVIASHISGLTRAVLGDIIRQVCDLGGRIISCTTDGFITDIKDLQNKLNFESTLLKLYSGLRKTLSNDTGILELKDSTTGIITWSTRGQLALTPSSKISAMTGFQPRFLTMEDRIKLVKNAFEEESLSIYYGQSSLRRVNDIYKEGGHVTSKITEKVFRIVYDNRREIIESDGLKPSKGLLFTKPFINKEVALTIKTIGSLGSDLYAPNTGYVNKSGSTDYIDIALRSFLRALIQHKLNLVNPFNSYQEIVQYVKNDFGIEIKPNYIATQKRREFIPNIVPDCRQTRSFVQTVLVRFPDFNVKKFFKLH